MLYLAREKLHLWQVGSVYQVPEMDFIGKQMRKLGMVTWMKAPQYLEQLQACGGWMINVLGVNI